jgi:hypothetical protein
MQQEFTLEGNWKLPSWEDQKTKRGTLHYVPGEGIDLKLQGSFDEPAKPQAGVSLIAVQQGHYPVVYGRTDDGIPVTLFELWGVQLPNWPFPAQMTRYHSMWLILGEFVNGLENWKYARIYIRLHNLEEFIGRNPFVHTRTHTDPNFSLSYKQPTPLKAKMGRYEMSSEHLGAFNGPRVSGAEFSYSAWLKFSTDADTDIFEFLRGPLYTLGSLIDFAGGSHFPTLALIGEHQDSESHGPRVFKPIEIFYKQRRSTPLPRRREAVGRQPNGFAFALADLEPDLSRHLEAWGQSIDRHGGAFSQFFSLDPIADDDISTDFHFMSLATALEAYHDGAH